MDKIISSILAFLFSVVGGWFTPVTPIETEPAAEDAVRQEITVMNFNVYVAGSGQKSPENRTDKVAAIIRDVMPDSFGVEEADSGWLERLSAALPEYAYVGKGRNSDFSGEASPVFYLKDKYELVKSETFWLSKTPDKPSRGWDAWINRVCTSAVLRNIETGFTYAHFNAHFDNSGAVSRCEAVAVVSKKINEMKLPTVFTGDLNAKEGTLMYERILSSGLKDIKYIAAESDSGATYHGYTGLDKVNGKPIDYIFANACVTDAAYYRIIRDTVDGILPSDHYPVAAKLTLSYNP